MLSVVAFVISTHSVAAQKAPASLNPWTEVTIMSSVLKEQRKVFVATPDGYVNTTRPYPVLVLLDAEDPAQFGAAIANVRFLTSRSAIQPLIIVGVPNAKDRTHDLTPPPGAKDVKNFPTAGGADTFAAFLVREVVPAVRAKYRTAPYTILAGHSFGGLFAVRVAGERPGAFNAIIAMSPSLWWKDSALVKPYADAIAHNRVPLKFFTTSGGHEGMIDRPTRAFAARLDSLAAPPLVFGHRHYPDDSHDLTPLPSLVDGLRFVFEPLSLATSAFDKVAETDPDSASMMRAFDETEQTYARNVRAFPGRDLGMTEALPEEFSRFIGVWALEFLHLPSVARLVYERNVHAYPRSPTAHADLGDALLASADTSGARTHYGKASALARANKNAALAKTIGEKLKKAGHAATP